MTRFLILATIALAGLSLGSSSAMAEEPQQGSSTTTIETARDSVAPVPAYTDRGRLSTRDRWRGRPYLRSSVRSSGGEALRGNILDVALPPANRAFQGGIGLQGPATRVSEQTLRTEALDKALPPANPSFVGGSSTGGLGL